MKIKTSELTGAALDWAVQLALGTHWSSNGYFCFDNPKRYDSKPEWRYSTDWSQGGPIIEREHIWLRWTSTGGWQALHGEFKFPTILESFGPTPLIAAMRCFVASRLGDEVEIPVELMK